MIKRHQFDYNKLGDPEFSLSQIQKYLKMLESNADLNLQPLLKRCLTYSRSLIIQTGDVNEIQSGLNKYLICGTAFLKSHIDNKDTVTLTLDDKTYSLSQREPNIEISFLLFNLIIQTFIVETSVFKKIHLDLIDLVLLQEENPFWNSALRFFTGIINKSDKIVYEELDKLSEIAEQGQAIYYKENNNKSVTLNEESRLLFKRIWLPIFELFAHAYFKKEKSFNELLETHLKLKKTYIETNGKKDDPNFWVDFHTLAACAYGMTNKIDVKVKSEYIPLWIIKSEAL